MLATVASSETTLGRLAHAPRNILRGSDMILTATGITKDADLDDCVGAASPAFERPAFQRQTSEVISTIDEPTENINLSWNAPEFYKRLKRFRRTQLECE